MFLVLQSLVISLEGRPVLEVYRHQKNMTQPFLNLFAKRKLVASRERLTASQAAEPMRISPGGPDPKHH